MSTERVRRIVADLADCTRSELKEIADSLEGVVDTLVSDTVSAITRQYEHEVWTCNAGAVSDTTSFSHRISPLHSDALVGTTLKDGPRDPIIPKEDEPY